MYNVKNPPGFPRLASLKTAMALAEDLKIPESSFIEWAEAGYIPHYRLKDAPGYWFKYTEVREWLYNNQLIRVEGRPMPKDLRIFRIGDEITDAPPKCIAHVENLVAINTTVYPPSVYFLCDGPEVVYVGQSISLVSRLASHIASGKKFDRVYAIHVPVRWLNTVESAYIRALRPKLNGAQTYERLPTFSVSIPKEFLPEEQSP